MNNPQYKYLDLPSIADSLPQMTRSFCSFMAEAGAVCFHKQGHSSGTEMDLVGDITERYQVFWQEVSEQMKNSYHDDEVATEYGAYGIALLLIKDISNYSIVQRSRKGTGFDFWLGTTDNFLFQNIAKLEVSGIRNGNINREVITRKSQKITQINKSNNHLPGFVVIVEFSKPISLLANTQ